MTSLAASPSPVPPRRLKEALVCAAVWSAWMGAFALSRMLDATAQGEPARVGHVLATSAVAFGAWIVLTPLVFFLGAPWIRAARDLPGSLARFGLLACGSLAADIAYNALYYGAVTPLSPLEVIRSVRAFDWLWNPVLTASVCAAAFAFARSDGAPARAANTSAHAIAVRHRGRIEFVPKASILAVSARGNYVALILENGEALARASLDGVLAELCDHGFVRVHRSHGVKRSAVAEFAFAKARHVELTNKRRIPVSRRYAGAVARALETAGAASDADQVSRSSAARSGPGNAAGRRVSRST